MFSGTGDGVHASLDDNDIAKELAKQSELSEELLQEAEEMRKMRSELKALRAERTEIQQQSRTLMKSVLVSEREEKGARRDYTHNIILAVVDA